MEQLYIVYTALDRVGPLEDGKFKLCEQSCIGGWTDRPGLHL